MYKEQCVTPEDGTTDKTPLTIKYEYNPYSDLIHLTVQMLEDDVDDRLSTFQYIQNSVSDIRVDRGVTLISITGAQKVTHHRIYMYSSPHLKTKNNAVIGDTAESKSMMMYICINCAFAEWVQNQLIEFVEQIPNMYNTLFVPN